MATASVPQGDPAPILDPVEQDLDFVALFVACFAVAAPCRSVLARRDARFDVLLLQGGDKPISVIAAVGEQMFCFGKTGQKASRACVIACLPFCQQQAHRLARVVTHGVHFRIQTAFRAANTAGYCPFVSRLAAVLWAFRCVGSIIRHSLAPCGRDNSRKILLKIPARLQRTKRV